MFKWVRGRQVRGHDASGYSKMVLLWSKRFRFDCHLLRFEEGQRVPWHRDPAPKGKHYRLNILLNKVEGGNVYLMEGKPIISCRLFMLFRPDIHSHMMTKVRKGTLYMLSFGKVI